MGSGYEKKWQFDMNRAYGDITSTLNDTAKYVIWYYKAFLTGQVGGATHGLWTVVGSSDAATAGMDGVDRWGATFDATKIVTGSANTPHSWVVLQSPPMKKVTYYLLLDYVGSNGQVMTIWLGNATAPTGGTNQAAPTIPNGTRWGTGTQNFHHTSNPGSIRVHGSLASDGSFTILLSRDNTGRFASGFLLHWLANARPADQYPVWLYLKCDATMGTGFGGANYCLDDSTNYGIMRSPDNSGGSNWAAILPAATNFPILLDAFDGSSTEWDIWVGTANTTYRSVRGRLQDISYIGGGVNTGSIDSTVGGAARFMTAGLLWFPTNDAPIL